MKKTVTSILLTGVIGGVASAASVYFTGGDSSYGWNDFNSASIYKDAVAPTATSDFVLDMANVVSPNQTGLLMVNTFTINSMEWCGSLWGAKLPSGSLNKGILVGTSGHTGDEIFTVTKNIELIGSNVTGDYTYLSFITRGKNADLTTNVKAGLSVGGNIIIGDYSLSTYTSTLQVGGTGSNAGDTSFYNSPYASFTVGGDVYISAANNNLKLNVGLKTYADTLDLSTPDSVINGRLVGYNGTDSKGVVYKNKNTTAFSWSNIVLRNVVASTNTATPINDA